MSKEEVLVALKELFPDGIPDACGMVMAHKDAPFKSYQELRKILKRSSAWGNRRNWKFLLDGVDDVDPPKQELAYSVTISPATLIKTNDVAVVKFNITSGELDPEQTLVSLEYDMENGGSVHIGEYDIGTNTVELTYAGLAEKTYLCNIAVSTKDLNSGETVLPTNSIAITLTEAPDLVADWSVTPSLLAKGSSATAKVTVTAGKLGRSRLTAVGENASLVEIDPTSSPQGEHSVNVVGDKVGETATVDLNMYVVDDKNGQEKLLGVKKITITAGEAPVE